MARIKSAQEIEALRAGGHILAQIIDELLSMVRSGVSLDSLDSKARELIESVGARPSFLYYHPKFSTTPFPSTICACVNEEVVHGFGNRQRSLKNGDIVSIDIGMQYQNLFTDMAKSVPVGKCSKVDRKLLRVTAQALEVGIKTIRPKISLSEVGRRIQRYVESQGFQVVRSLVGHGVGHQVHEEPPVPNYFDESLERQMLEAGMVLALEPMVTIGSHEVITLDDGWTVVTKDGSRSAHFEHTVVVTENGAEILTQ